MSAATYHSLKLINLSLQVHLGCTAGERLNTQEVRVSIDIRFHEVPPGIHTDALTDTVCYAELSYAFNEFVAQKEFALIEKLAQGLFDVSQKIVRERGLIALAVHKVKPPVENLIGGAEYRIAQFT